MQTLVKKIENLEYVNLLVKDIGTRNIKSIVITPYTGMVVSWLVTITHS